VSQETGGGFALSGARPLGCLLVHGLTATAEEMRPLGEALAARGFPVRAVCLAGHGTDLAGLARTGWADWFASVTDGLARLQAEVPRVAVTGMSLGGLLALHLAATRPATVEGLVLCGTPIRLLGTRIRLLPILARLPFVARRYATIRKANGKPDIADPAMRATSQSYPAVPLVAVLELLRLRALVWRELPSVTQPALLLHGRHDHSVPVTNLEVLRGRLGSRSIETHVLERSWHVITLDYDREQVAGLTAAFLERLEAQTAAGDRPG